MITQSAAMAVPAALSLADTVPPPAKKCSCCGREVFAAEWIASPRRRHWPGFLVEIAEVCCANSLIMPINAEPAVVQHDEAERKLPPPPKVPSFASETVRPAKVAA